MGQKGGVSRDEVVQACLDLFEDADYLEVGVAMAKTFQKVRAARKVAVDPAFGPGVSDLLATLDGVAAHQVTSDAYFGAIAGGRRFDAIYLDGLHTFEQTLRDLLNAVALLKEPGVIVVDDAYPDSDHGSLPDRGRSKLIMRETGPDNRRRMGDAYKLTFFIDTFLQQFTYAMTSDNHGQLIVWRKARPKVTERSVEAVARAPWEQVFVEAEAQRRAPLAAVIAGVARDLGRPMPALRVAAPAPAAEASQGAA